MDDLSRQAILARSDEKAFENLVRENKNFIKKVAYNTVHRFVTESDDEWSVALLAFHEAVRHYDVGKGEFAAFSGMVIKRRLMDYMTSENRHGAEMTVEPGILAGDRDDLEDLTALQSETLKGARRQAERLGGDYASPESSPVKDEIDAMQQVLSGYGFSFFDLAESSPKAEKTKKMCGQIIGFLSGDPVLMRKMRSTGTLPVKEILEKIKVPRKITERHRKYIIASAEILGGDYPLLGQYLEGLFKP